MLTFDLFSALIDSRSGGSTALQRIAGAGGWRGSGDELYDRWDALSKAAQRDCDDWVPFAFLARKALAAAYEQLGISGDPARDTDELLDTVEDWPLWPDVAEQLPRLARTHRLGILSNVDDDILRRTQAAPLVDLDLALTSQRLGAYKPSPLIYQRAVQAAGPLVHIASSARDVRGALEAGILVVRLLRPGHHLDPQGPQPPHTAAGLAELEAVLQRLPAHDPSHHG
jgi:2-haloalkanoic acid dehalogenase type II